MTPQSGAFEFLRHIGKFLVRQFASRIDADGLAITFHPSNRIDFKIGGC